MYKSKNIKTISKRISRKLKEKHSKWEFLCLLKSIKYLLKTCEENNNVLNSEYANKELQFLIKELEK